MTHPIDIRLATPDDYPTLGDVMYDAVRNGRSEYTEEQRQSWVPQPPRGSQWVKRLEHQTIFVAYNPSQIVGFMSLATNGYIDLAYLRPPFQGTGIFRRLYQSLEDWSQINGNTRLWVHASLMAQKPFAVLGFMVTKKETVNIANQSFDRFEMEKPIIPSGSTIKT